MPAKLPPNPNLHQLRRQGHELLRAFRAGEEEALSRIASNFPKLEGESPERIREATLGLRDALLVVAREYGFSSWPNLQEYVGKSDDVLL